MNWPQWLTLAHYDIVQRFRRSVLGPLWITLSFGMMVAALGAVYSTILGEEPRRYVPYLAAGLIIWGFIASTIQQGCEVFIQEASVLWQIYLPKAPACIVCCGGT